jgi:hypothetical protein
MLENVKIDPNWQVYITHIKDAIHNVILVLNGN